MAGMFKITRVDQFPPKQKVLTEENKYWNLFKSHSSLEQTGVTTHLSFCPNDSNDLAISSTSKISVYNPQSKEIIQTFTKSSKALYSGFYRSDAELLIAGAADSKLRLFNPSTKSQLRTFKGHKNEVHFARFTSDNFHVISGSDDKSIKYWDISEAKTISTYLEHTDYVRCGFVSAKDSNFFLSGSYDHTARFFDVRLGSSVFSVDHGDPIFAVLLLPNPSIIITAGGPVIKFWDVGAGGKLIHEMTPHHKAITALSFCRSFSRILSSSLDKQIKVIDVDTRKTLHSFAQEHAILSLGVSNDDALLAFSTTNSIVRIKEYQARKKLLDDSKGVEMSTFHYVRRISQLNARQPNLTTIRPNDVYRNGYKHAHWDILLKRCQPGKALDYVLHVNFAKKSANVVVAVMQQLLRMGQLDSAIAGRSYASLFPLLKFIVANITDHAYTKVLLNVAVLTVDIHAPNFGCDASTDAQFKILSKLCARHSKFAMLCHRVIGLADCIHQETKSKECEEDVFISTMLQHASQQSLAHFLQVLSS